MPSDQPALTRFVTLAYGQSPSIYRQSLMLLVSLIAHAPGSCELFVATDRPECYVWLGTRVEIEYLDRERLDSWRGSNAFSMRQKLEVLRDLWPASGAVVLLDADVLAVRDLAPFVRQVHEGALFMHKREYVLSESRRAGNRKLWSALQSAKLGVHVTTNDAMWNSGVVAVPAADRHSVERALALYDECGASGVRHFATEQLVESLVFARTGRLHAAEPWFVHYWGNKDGYDAEIARRLSSAFIEGMSVKEAAEAYRASPIDLPVEVRPSPAKKLRRWLDRR